MWRHTYIHTYTHSSSSTSSTTSSNSIIVLLAINKYTPAWSHLLDERTQECATNRQGFHDQDQIPVDQWAICEGVSLFHVQERIGDGSAEDGDVGQGNGVLRAKLQDQDVDRDEDAAASDAACRGDHKPKGGQHYRRDVPSETRFTQQASEG